MSLTTNIQPLQLQKHQRTSLSRWAKIRPASQSTESRLRKQWVPVVLGPHQWQRFRGKRKHKNQQGSLWIGRDFFKTKRQDQKSIHQHFRISQKERKVPLSSLTFLDFSSGVALQLLWCPVIRWNTRIEGVLSHETNVQIVALKHTYISATVTTWRSQYVSILHPQSGTNIHLVVFHSSCYSAMAPEASFAVRFEYIITSSYSRVWGQKTNSTSLDVSCDVVWKKNMFHLREIVFLMIFHVHIKSW